LTYGELKHGEVPRYLLIHMCQQLRNCFSVVFRKIFFLNQEQLYQSMGLSPRVYMPSYRLLL
jgi:hypothetical protein